MTDRELMQQALDALFNLRWAASERDKKNRIRQFDEFMDGSDEAIEALRARLAQPEQEPVAWLYRTNNTWEHVSFVEPPDDAYDEGSLRPVYTTPPQREWVGLTDEEIHSTNGYEEDRSLYRFARAIEAKLKEKNEKL